MPNPFKRRFDRMSGPAFRSAGVADAGTLYRREPSGVTTAYPMAEVYVDETVQVFGEQAGVATMVITLRLFKRFNIPTPSAGDRVVTDGDAFRVDAITDQDSSSYVVIVSRDSA